MVRLGEKSDYYRLFFMLIMISVFVIIITFLIALYIQWYNSNIKDNMKLERNVKRDEYRNIFQNEIKQKFLRNEDDKNNINYKQEENIKIIEEMNDVEKKIKEKQKQIEKEKEKQRERILKNVEKHKIKSTEKLKKHNEDFISILDDPISLTSQFVENVIDGIESKKQEYVREFFNDINSEIINPAKRFLIEEEQKAKENFRTTIKEMADQLKETIQ